MSEGKHTPGPWLRTGQTIYALIHDGWRLGEEQFRNWFTAHVQPDRECSKEEAEKIARLIAAAPDMLAALERCDPGLDWEIPERAHNGTIFCEITVGDIRAIRAAIRKVKGEA